MTNFSFNVTGTTKELTAEAEQQVKLAFEATLVSLHKLGHSVTGSFAAHTVTQHYHPEDVANLAPVQTKQTPVQPEPEQTPVQFEPDPELVKAVETTETTKKVEK